MQSNRSRDTKPELALRSAVHALGLRYRVNARPLKDVRRTADLVFTRAKAPSSGWVFLARMPRASHRLVDQRPLLGGEGRRQ